jgi:hypothetical protein
MICRCKSCNTATNVYLQRGVQIKDYRCYCGGELSKVTITYLDGQHPTDINQTRFGEYGPRKNLPYFKAFKSDGKHFTKTADKFIEI